jgi:sugar/nucleoside kinase (ribokinase family)
MLVSASHEPGAQHPPAMAQLPMSDVAEAPVRIASIGLASWDHFLAVDHFPVVGAYQKVVAERSVPGGQGANTAVALARLGAVVRVASLVGEDDEGARVRQALTAEGVDTTWLGTRSGEATDRSTIVVSTDPPDRTIFWHRGAELQRGDQLDVAAIFNHDVVILGVADAALRRFLVDLPAHTAPRARLLGPMTFLLEDSFHDGFEIALRHDVIVGSERELLALSGTWTLADAVTAIQTRMPGSNLRGCVVTRGAAGCRVVTREERWQLPAFPVTAVDPTGAGDAFAAGVAYGLARRWEWPRIAQFANAMGALATRALGAQAALPGLDEVNHLIASAGDRPGVDANEPRHE